MNLRISTFEKMKDISELNTIKVRKPTITSTLLIRQSFSGYHCELHKDSLEKRPTAFLTLSKFFTYVNRKVLKACLILQIFVSLWPIST